jgi:hypothetical protein
MIALLEINIRADYLLEASLVFAMATAGLLIFIVVYLNDFVRQKRKNEHLRSIYSSFLSEIILCDTKEELLECINKRYVQSMKKRWLYDEIARSLLIREMVQAAKSLSGGAKDNVLWLYDNLALQEDNVKRLQSKNWHVKARSIQELAEMKQTDIITRIYRETNSRNKYIRAEAQIAVVKLTGFDGLRFLNVLSQPISVWQQICLLEQLPPFGIDSEKVGKWLRSSNESVIEFTLRLIQRYQLYDQVEATLSFLEHPLKNIRLQAVQTLCDLDAEGTIQLLEPRLSSASLPLKQSFLSLAGFLGAAESMHFLQPMTADKEEAIATQAQQMIQRIQNELADRAPVSVANNTKQA